MRLPYRAMGNLNRRPFYFGTIIVGFAVLFSAECRISRMLYRARIFRFRKRPNLALSPFLTDIISPLMNSLLQFR